MAGKIVIRGARVHNLKNIDLEIPRDRLVVMTGVSGSGKSSLAFDTLFAEGQRRYLESLSADARRFLHQMERPEVDSIEGLSPAIAIEQKLGIYTPRSTVGTLTEIHDYLRLLFARIGEPTCPRCGRKITARAIQQIVDQLTELPEGTRVVILAPVMERRKGDPRERLQELAREGFTRVRIDGEFHELAEPIKLDRTEPHNIDLVIDRLSLREGVRKRLADSLEVASRFGNQVVRIAIQANALPELPQEMIFSQKLACLECGIGLPELTPGLFSPNSASGACPNCAGFGTTSPGGRKPARGRLSAAAICEACSGTGLRSESRAVKLGGRNLAEVAALTIVDAEIFFDNLELRGQDQIVGQKVLREVMSRLRFLAHVGLGYLTLDRRSATLSAGEAQRVRLAKQIGADLTGVLYILDEPTIGLHQRDNGRLLELLKRLRDAGNSLIVVEHDEQTIREADHVIDMGPGAGVQGGCVVAQGVPETLLNSPASLTGGYLSGRLQIAVPSCRRGGTGGALVIKGAREHNLKDITVEFPIGVMTCVTGVSGSGKSSLVMDVLYPAVARRLHRSRAKAGKFDRLLGWQAFDRVVGIDQAPIGRTPRSTPAVYTGLFAPIRALFAQLPEARVRGYSAQRFSFNVAGGRCETCSGDGVVEVAMYFLPEIFVTCDVCKGARYNRETLEIRYKGLSIADVLGLTVSQAAEIFASIPAAADRLQTLREVGLGYIKLGQPASTLSGGEAQRVKLAHELGRRSEGQSLYILDEPTSGLHFDDVKKLLDMLHQLTDSGNTIVVVEHNLDIIKSADHVIDLGPEGGAGGGWLVAKGTPEEIASVSSSFTGEYLKKALAAASKRAQL